MIPVTTKINNSPLRVANLTLPKALPQIKTQNETKKVGSLMSLALIKRATLRTMKTHQTKMKTTLRRNLKAIIVKRSKTHLTRLCRCLDIILMDSTSKLCNFHLLKSSRSELSKLTRLRISPSHTFT